MKLFDIVAGAGLAFALGIFAWTAIGAVGNGALTPAPRVEPAAIAAAETPQPGKRFADRLPIEDDRGVHTVGRIELRANADGHFYAEALVNGVPTRMLIDTGATTSSLTYDAAVAAGVDQQSLRFTLPVQTANGIAYAAPVKLERLRVGPIEISGIEVKVARHGALDRALLGMDFLNLLTSFNIAGDTLTMELANPPIYRTGKSGS